MDLIITILPVVTKDLPISPRFMPYDFFYRDASSALLWYNSSTNHNGLKRKGEKKKSRPSVEVAGFLPAPCHGSTATRDFLSEEIECRKGRNAFSRRRSFMFTTVH